MNRVLDLVSEPPGASKERAYQELLTYPPDFEIHTLEVLNKDGTNRILLCEQEGFYIGHRHALCPELVVQRHGIFYTDSEISSWLWIPEDGCIPETSNAWRLVWAPAGTIIQLTHFAIQEKQWPGSQQVSLSLA